MLQLPSSRQRCRCYEQHTSQKTRSKDNVVPVVYKSMQSSRNWLYLTVMELLAMQHFETVFSCVLHLRQSCSFHCRPNFKIRLKIPLKLKTYAPSGSFWRKCSNRSIFARPWLQMTSSPTPLLIKAWSDLGLCQSV